MATCNGTDPGASTLGRISLALGILEWVAVLGSLAAAGVLGRSPRLVGDATLVMFASLPVMVVGTPLGVYAAVRGCRWAGWTGALLCLSSCSLGSFILRDIVSKR